jgi:ammonia channel protein AmtB
MTSRFQLMFAVITAALISGGTVDRMRFPGFALFIGLWVLLVGFAGRNIPYDPVFSYGDVCIEPVGGTQEQLRAR